MFNQWFFFICSLVFVRSGTEPKADELIGAADDLRNISSYVQADNQYGWQVAGRSVSAYELTK